MKAAKPLPKRTAPARARKPWPTKPRLLAFSCGYEGRGIHTRELVEMVDAIEHAQRPCTRTTEQGP